ncbi:MAG: RecQ family ATP-dependent DNA helicase [Defluviitaleaceae bacterium]|nr:RecQ family ATP-dependent DNA helicase [Defluviitaleaceae bacterium]
MKTICFFDIEVSENKKIVDIGVTDGFRDFHTKNIEDFLNYIKNYEYICGHNIIAYDLKYLQNANIFIDNKPIDTLFISTLLLPLNKYHALVKDDKIYSDEINNPVSDSKKASYLLGSFVSDFWELKSYIQNIYYSLLCNIPQFKFFFEYIGFFKTSNIDIEKLIFENFDICKNCNLKDIIKFYKVELCYALSHINVIKEISTMPPWVVKNFPNINFVIDLLRGTTCEKCTYCLQNLDAKLGLEKYFGYDNFRKYGGINLQEDAVKSALKKESLIAIFPTGGGKSLTFQLPALMDYENKKALTVIISPLQSLMKDQMDNLEAKTGVTTAVTINGSLDPISRKNAILQVENGSASILYISPEMLRFRTIEILLKKRRISRFVIDEAHCFSSWGHDFRVDYLYIGDFIANLNLNNIKNSNIPVSCFTATAKQRVIEDIQSYFLKKLNIDMKIFKSEVSRKNLDYKVIKIHNDKKDEELLNIILENIGKVIIIYASRTKKTEEISKFLNSRGENSLFYHGKMDTDIRTLSQEKFMKGEVNIIVATTAFGMGVDKENVEVVIHYDISDSVENYVQEAGRAGRNENINATCYILYTEEDLDKHFILLNQTKINKVEIEQIWRAIKDISKNGIRNKITVSALDIARQSGWNDTVYDVETRVRTAINSLEQSKHIKRNQNSPHVFATSILPNSMVEASQIIQNATMEQKDKNLASIIMSKLFGAKSKKDNDGESRVDYLADTLGIDIKDIIRIITKLKEICILKDETDINIKISISLKSVKKKLDLLKKIEIFLIKTIGDREEKYKTTIFQKEFNEQNKIDGNKNEIDRILNYYSRKNVYKISKTSIETRYIKPLQDKDDLLKKVDERYELLNWILEYLYNKKEKENIDNVVDCSVLGLAKSPKKFMHGNTTEEIENAIYFLEKQKILNISGGFLVIYQRMNIEVLKSSRFKYAKEDYSHLEKFYLGKIQAIHIVGKYAELLSTNQKEAIVFIKDYFEIEYQSFLRKYFKNSIDKIKISMTPARYQKIFGELSLKQREIIEDKVSKNIVVLAGPGSGKTKLLTHKLAALYSLEENKREHLLMLTFSRIAAVEFKTRLIKLMGNAANHVEITTFHSFCLNILGKIGSSENITDIVKQTAKKIENGEIDSNHVQKAVIVIDEAQDMSLDEYNLVKAICDVNENTKIIAVGDDDQNIYGFRGSNSEYFKKFADEKESKQYYLIENYRSSKNVINFANDFVKNIKTRYKQEEIIPIRDENGIVNIKNILSKNIEIPIVNDVIEISKDERYTGTTCVIVRTNDEVNILASMIRKQKIKVKTLGTGTNKEFRLYLLDEIYTFVKLCNVNEYLEYTTISDEVWKNAKNEVFKKYEKSRNLNILQKAISIFEKIYTKGQTKTKYKAEFIHFIEESKMEDFFDISDLKNTIFVSTIHQTKGKEFDNVILGLKINNTSLTQENLRAIYVAITRAKNNLNIVSYNEFFGNITDRTQYDKPKIIAIELSHSDVYLDFFKNVQKEIGYLQSGNELYYSNNGLHTLETLVCILSKSFKSETLPKYIKQDYKISRAFVRHIVYWRASDSEEYIRIILPYLEMERK